jgi:enamine deaminase RidA (YjgF/YER057c/UK114 family)
MLKPLTLVGRIRAHSHNAAHAMEVPANGRLLFCNGQVGTRLDGTIPESAQDQVELIFERIGMILSASHMTFRDIVKFTVYVTDASVLDHYFEARARLLGEHNPPATLLLVSAFPRAGLKLEIEAIAAKADK